MANTKKVFVMMSFEKTFDWVYDDLIRPPFEDAGYDVVRADDITSQQNIIKSIIIGIHDADLIIADLSGLNANVFYELGIAHAKGKNVVLLSHDLANAPFNLRSYNIIGYEPRGSNFDYAKRRLLEIATDTDGAIAFGSPVSDFWPQRKSTGRTDSRRSDDLDDEDADGDSEDISGPRQRARESEPQKDAEENLHEDGPGTLDLALQIADSSEDGKKILEAIGVEIVALGEEARSLTPEVENLTKRKDARGLSTLFRRFSEFLNKKGDVINDLVVEFRAVWDASSNAMRTYFFHPDVDQASRTTALREVHQLSQGGASARDGVSGFISALRRMPNIERRFTKAKRRLVRVLEAFLVTITDVAALETRMIHIDQQMAREEKKTKVKVMLKADFKREVLRLWRQHKESSPDADAFSWWTRTIDARPNLTYRRRSNTDLWQVVQGWLQ